MRPIAAACVLVMSLVVLPDARAQDLSPRERAWSAGLAQRLGRQPAAPARIARRLADGTAVSGVQVALGDLVVGRLRFSSPEQAQRHARVLLDGQGGDPLVGELRGAQVVIVHGASARDPRLASQALEAAWAGLPAASTNDARFANLGDGTVAVRTTLASGPLRAGVDDALNAARRAARRPGARGIVLSRDGARTVTGRVVAGMRSDATGASLFMATAPDRERAARAYLSALGGHPRPASATASGAESVGAAAAVEGLFGR